MEIDGLPVHPLVVHAAVVLTPLAVLLAWTLVAWPAARWVTRWLAPGAAALALLTVVLATSSGEALLEARPFLESSDSPVRDLVREHEELGEQLQLLMVAFTVTVAAAWWLLPAESPLASGRLAHAGRGGAWPRRGVAGVVVVLGLLCLVWVIRTGDAGARAVWGL